MIGRARSLVLALAVTLPLTGAAARDQASVPLPGPWTMISFEMKSWGRPITAWNLLPDGSGGWNETEDGISGQFADYVTVWHDVPADPEAQARLVALLQGLPYPAPDSGQCTNMMTDQPYGTLRLTSGATTIELAFNAGCLDDDYVAFLDRLRAANELVATRGRAAPVMRRERPDGSWIEDAAD